MQKCDRTSERVQHACASHAHRTCASTCPIFFASHSLVIFISLSRNISDYCGKYECNFRQHFNSLRLKERWKKIYESFLKFKPENSYLPSSVVAITTTILIIVSAFVLTKFGKIQECNFKKHSRPIVKKGKKEGNG